MVNKIGVGREFTVPDRVFLDIEQSKKVIDPDSVDDHFRDLIRSFSPTIYIEMTRRNMFYELQGVVYSVARKTGWEIDE